MLHWRLPAFCLRIELEGPILNAIGYQIAVVVAI